MLGHLRSVAPGEHGEGTKDQHRWSDGLDPRFCNSSFLDFFFFFFEDKPKNYFWRLVRCIFQGLQKCWQRCGLSPSPVLSVRGHVGAPVGGHVALV